MTIEGLIARYGLLAVFAGAGIEGETAVVAGGVLAHRGLLSPVGAGLAAMAGSFAADQAFFHLGRRYRDRGPVRRLRARPSYARAMGFLERHPHGFIIAYRFIYGFRTVSPIAIGTSDIAGRLFFIVNLFAAALWGALFTAVGYLFGNVIEEAIGRIAGDRLAWLIVGAAAVALLVWGIRWWKGRR